MSFKINYNKTKRKNIFSVLLNINLMDSLSTQKKYFNILSKNMNINKLLHSR